MKVDSQGAVQDVCQLPTVDRSNKQQERKQDIAAEQSIAVKQEPSREEVSEAVNFANKAMKMSNYHLEFVMEQNNTRYQVKVIDSDSGDVIREIPSDYMMKFTEKVKNSMDDALGIMLDELA